MPILSFAISNLKKAIQEPVCYSIIEDLRKNLELRTPPKITLIESGDTISTHGSAYDVQQLNLPLLDAEDRLIIEYEYETEIEDLTTVAVHQIENQHIFHDPTLGVFVKNIYLPEKIKLNFKYYFKSKAAAQGFHNEFMVRLAQMRDIFEHVVSMHYPIEPHIYSILHDIHEKREAVAPYGETLEQYLSRHITTRTDLAMDSVGNTATLVIPERRARVIAHFEPKLIEKPQKEDNNYVINFSYVFTYDKPVMQVIQYPIMVHNQLLKPELTEFPLDIAENEFKDYRRTLSQQGMETFEQTNAMHRFMHKIGFYHLPIFDDFVPKNPPPGTVTIFTVLCSVDEHNKKDLFNLYDLGELSLHDEVIQFLAESEHPYLTRVYNSIFSVELYRDHYITSPGTLTCSPLLDIAAAKELDLRRMHRVRFSLCIDFTLLSRDAILRLGKYPSLSRLILDNLYDYYLRGGLHSKLGAPKPYMNLYEMLDLATWWYLLTGSVLDPSMPPNHELVQWFLYETPIFNGGRNRRPTVPYRPGTSTPANGLFKEFAKLTNRTAIENFRANAIHNKTVMISNLISLRVDP